MKKINLQLINYLNFVILKQRMIKSRLLIDIHTIEPTNITWLHMKTCSRLKRSNSRVSS
jgi:hypothetical protein